MKSTVAVLLASMLMAAAGSASAVSKLGTAINLGNCLEAPVEGSWAPPAQQYYFTDYKAAGFTTVRIPVRWDNHTLQDAPYTIDPVFMARVQEVVGWSLAEGLHTIINSHHDDWLDNVAAFPSMLPRYAAIWQQISNTFSTAPELLMFEDYNEPHVMTVDQLNTMIQTFYNITRPANPTRTLFIGGLNWNSPSWVTSNPSAIVLPGGGKDPYLALEIHDYDPFHFTTPPISINTWGTPTDVAAVYEVMGNMTAWSTANGGIPIFLGEFGCSGEQSDRAARLAWYQTFAEAVKAQGPAFTGFSLWDDDGW